MISYEALPCGCLVVVCRKRESIEYKQITGITGERITGRRPASDERSVCLNNKSKS